MKSPSAIIVYLSSSQSGFGPCSPLNCMSFSNALRDSVRSSGIIGRPNPSLGIGCCSSLSIQGSLRVALKVPLSSLLCLTPLALLNCK